MNATQESVANELFTKLSGHLAWQKFDPRQTREYVEILTNPKFLANSLIDLLRKWIWIEPYWKGPEASPALIRPHVLSPASAPPTA
jgi:hypothetical protein